MATGFGSLRVFVRKDPQCTKFAFLHLARPPVVARFDLDAEPVPTATTEIAGVYPLGERIPENLLKWYVEFSASMSVGEAYRHVRLLDHAGKEVPKAFLMVDEELWSDDRRRLTLLFDPGRVKRGIRSNLEMAAPLVAGRRYTLTIDSGWRDGRGAPLVAGYRRRVRSGSGGSLAARSKPLAHYGSVGGHPGPTCRGLRRTTRSHPGRRAGGRARPERSSASGHVEIGCAGQPVAVRAGSGVDLRESHAADRPGDRGPRGK